MTDPRVFAAGLGERVRRGRIDARLTRVELARAVGVAPRTVHRWEDGTRIPETHLVAPLARALGVSADTLLGV